MAFSNEFKINVNKLNADECLLVLIKIEHPFVSEPIRIVNDSEDFVFLTERYIHMPFTIKRQDDVQGELPKVSLSIANAGRSLVKWIDSSGGGRDAKVTVTLARRTSLAPEDQITFGISSVSINSNLVNISLVIQNNLIKRATRWVYNKDHAPGLFN